MFSFIRRAPLVVPCIFFVLGILLQFECSFQTSWHKQIMLVSTAAFLFFIFMKKMGEKWGKIRKTKKNNFSIHM
jgi:hypothetical protein